MKGQLVAWRDWDRSVRIYTGGSLLLLAALAVSGASA